MSFESITNPKMMLCDVNTYECKIGVITLVPELDMKNDVKIHWEIEYYKSLDSEDVIEIKIINIDADNLENNIETQEDLMDFYFMNLGLIPMDEGIWLIEDVDGLRELLEENHNYLLKKYSKKLGYSEIDIEDVIDYFDEIIDELEWNRYIAKILLEPTTSWKEMYYRILQKKNESINKGKMITMNLQFCY